MFCIACFAFSVFQMGYGSRALEMLQQYYEGRVPSLVESDNLPQQEAKTLSTEVRNILIQILILFGVVVR